MDSKLALVASLFGARSDVYAIRWENPSTGKSGWSPATMTEVDVRSAITDAGGLVGLIAVADRTERAALYRALGIGLTYERQTTGHELVRARLSLSGGGGRI